MSTTSSDTPVPTDAIPAELDALVGEWLSVPDVAEHLDQRVTRVHNLVHDRRLLAVRRQIGKRLAIFDFFNHRAWRDFQDERLAGFTVHIGVHAVFTAFCLEMALVAEI